MHTNNERQLLARIAELKTQQEMLAGALRRIKLGGRGAPPANRMGPLAMSDLAAAALCQLKAR